MMGGKKSHEYHILSETGEDHLLCCQDCGYSCNEEIIQQIVEQPAASPENCLNCQSTNIQRVKAIEVAHTFMLGDRYSKAFNATYSDRQGKPQLLYMGSYGIGVTRLLAAALEVLSDDRCLRWPTLLAPYDVCVIGCKQGSKEQSIADSVEAELCSAIGRIYDDCSDAFIHDDRKQMTIGKRLLEAQRYLKLTVETSLILIHLIEIILFLVFYRIGYPLIVVVGSKCLEQPVQVELFMNGKCLLLDVNSALNEISRYYNRNKRRI